MLIRYWQLSNFWKKTNLYGIRTRGLDSHGITSFGYYHLSWQHNTPQSVAYYVFKLSMNNLISIVTLTCDGYVKKAYTTYSLNIG